MSENENGDQIQPGQPRWNIFIIIAVLVGIPAGYGWYLHSGLDGIKGYLIGIAFGCLVTFVGRWLLKRQMTAGGHSIVSEMMLGSFFSFGIFMAGILFLVLFMKAPGALVIAASLSALVFYLGARLFEVISIQKNINK